MTSDIAHHDAGIVSEPAYIARTTPARYGLFVSRYLLMIRQEQPFPDDGPSGEQMHERFIEWTRQLHRDSVLLDVGRLSNNGGRTVRRRGRDMLTIDGPFAETKELVLGYFLIEASDEEHACQIAGQCPGLEYGASMEVRRMDDFPSPV